MNEKQLDSALKSAGIWFFVTEYELILNWKDDKESLVDLIFKTGVDSEKSGTVTRINAVKRIIDNKMDKYALEKIGNSKIVTKHSDARELSALLLKKYHCTDGAVAF